MSDDKIPTYPVSSPSKSNCLKPAGITCLIVFLLGGLLAFWGLNIVFKNPVFRGVAQCQNNLIQIGGALDRYRTRNGKYPASLADLHPKFLEDRNILHCSADPRHKDVVSYEYTQPPKDAPADTVVVICRYHILAKGQPPFELALRKDGKVRRYQPLTQRR